jgi:diguanylate cyclase (GGDEF)-like protein
MRESDTLARYGGDEFIALLTETDQQHAIEAAERIRRAVENTAFDKDGQQIRSTVSIGIASFPQQAGNTIDLLRKTDQALYASKNAGRNRVTVFDGV